MPISRIARRASGVALAAVSALALLAGCYYGGNPFGPKPSPSASASSSNAATPEEASGPFAEYFTQTVDWKPCAGDFECATVTAPMDWEDGGDSRTVPLGVVKHPATSGSSLGTLFYNPGGPGGSGVEYVRDYLDYLFTPDVIADYDIVGWDPRGVGESDPVTCFTDPQDVEEFLYMVPAADPATDPQGWAEAQQAEGKKYADACAKNTGEVLEFIDTLSTVRDLELLRAVSGDPVLNFLGQSYGTAIGAIYVDEYPGAVGRVVLDGVMDRESSLVDLNVSQMAGFELALTHFVQQCPTLYDDCPFGSDTDAGLARIHALLEQWESHPVTNADGRVMNGDNLLTGILMALYSEDYWPQLDQLFNEVLAPSPSTDTAWQLADLYNDFTVGKGYSSNLQDALSAIYCVDYPVDTDPAVLEDLQAQLEAKAPTITIDTPPIVDPICSNWPYHYRGGQHQQLTGKGAPPVLIVSTTGDPATPYAEGVKLADDLESGVLLTFDGEGHTAYGAYSNQCIVSAVDAYFLQDVVPKDGTTCEAD